MIKHKYRRICKFIKRLTSWHIFVMLERRMKFKINRGKKIHVFVKSTQNFHKSWKFINHESSHFIVKYPYYIKRTLTMIFQCNDAFSLVSLRRGRIFFCGIAVDVRASSLRFDLFRPSFISILNFPLHFSGTKSMKFEL